MKDWNIIALLAGCLLAVGAFVGLSLLRAPTPFETGLFQVVILIAGLLGSYMYGKNAAADAARDVIRPHARSAFRRVFSLYKSLYNLSNRIETMQRDAPDPRLDVIKTAVDEQISAGQDALEDWRDIIEDDVDEILERDGSIDWKSYGHSNAGEITGSRERRSENHDSSQTDSRQGRERSER